MQPLTTRQPLDQHKTALHLELEVAHLLTTEAARQVVDQCRVVVVAEVAVAAAELLEDNSLP